MQLTVFGYDLLILVGCLVFNINSALICKGNEYTVVRSDGSIWCLTCDTCHAGRGLDPPCGRNISDPPENVGCKDCPLGKFSDKYDSSRCLKCLTCSEHETVTEPCTNKSNTICSGTCKKGYFYSRKDSTYSCQKCSYCCFDGKDEVVPECANQGLNASKQHCSPRADGRDCSPTANSSPTALGSGTEASEGGGLSGTTVAAIVLGVFGVIIVAVLIFLVYRMRKSRRPNTAAQYNAENGTVQHHASFSQSVNSDGSKEVLNNAETPCMSGAESGAENGAGVNHDTRKEQAIQTIQTPEVLTGSKNKPSASFPYVSSSSNLPTVQEDAAVNLDYNRSLSRDSQKSGNSNKVFPEESAGAESGRRSRSSSTSSFTQMVDNLVRRRSSSKLKDEALVNNEEQDTGPIRITDEPPSQQEAVEGSKVELVFKCKDRDNRKLTYQWFKDDNDHELLGKNEPVLVFKPVALSDFGWYKCRASYKDSPSNTVESSPTELDVTPRDGTRYRYLTEIDPSTQDRIGKLLTQNIHGLGGWRQIAFKYGMDPLDIKSLQGDPEAGKKTLEYLEAHVPCLTVYDFCKALKDNTKRFDIVKELLDHLSISGSKKAFV